MIPNRKKLNQEVSGTWNEGARPEHGRSYTAPQSDPSLSDRAAQRQSFNEFWGGVVQNRQGLARDKFNEGQRQFGMTHDFAKQQHTDTHQLARDRLNQQGQQWQSTFDYGKARDQVGDTRYDQEGYDKRQQLERENELAARKQALEEGKAMRPEYRTGYDEETGQRTTLQIPGLEERDGRFIPGVQQPQLNLDDLTPEAMEMLRRQLRQSLGI